MEQERKRRTRKPKQEQVSLEQMESSKGEVPPKEEIKLFEEDDEYFNAQSELQQRLAVLEAENERLKRVEEENERLRKLVPVETETRKLSVTLPATVWSSIDEYLKKSNTKQASFFAELAKNYFSSEK